MAEARFAIANAPDRLESIGSAGASPSKIRNLAQAGMGESTTNGGNRASQWRARLRYFLQDFQDDKVTWNSGRTLLTVR